MRHRLPLAAATLALLATAAGCNLLGVVVSKTQGQAPIEAKHVPDPTVPLVVLVENFRDSASVNAAEDAGRVARMISARLAEQQVAPIVGPDQVRNLRDRSPTAYREMGVVQVARAVGAGQVLYVDLASVAVGAQTGSDVAKGQAAANIKFIDARSGLVAYPADLSDGAPVAFETPMRRLGDRANADSLRGEALAGLSERISRLFFKYKPDDLEALGADEDNLR